MNASQRHELEQTLTTEHPADILENWMNARSTTKPVKSYMQGYRNAMVLDRKDDDCYSDLGQDNDN